MKQIHLPGNQSQEDLSKGQRGGHIMSTQTPPPNRVATKNFWQGQYVRLRAIEPEDAEIFHNWNLDSEMARSVDFVWPPTALTATQAWAQRMATQEFKDDIVNFAI